MNVAKEDLVLFVLLSFKDELMICILETSFSKQNINIVPMEEI